VSDMLSQEQIDALLKSTNIEKSENELSEIEIDVLGEIGNICIGTSATALNEILEKTISINTPSVKIMTWEEISKHYDKTCVCVKVHYTQGLEGYNLMILKENDAKIITDLMLKDAISSSISKKGEALNEIHLSAVSEVMNQLVGSSATSMSLLISKKVDISPPEAFILNFDLDNSEKIFKWQEKLVKISFRMEVDGLLDSEIMQILPIDFAKKFIKNLLDSITEDLLAAVVYIL
jgi:flagellar motor switch protein FliN/FliY